jgi:hypothetical protein
VAKLDLSNLAPFPLPCLGERITRRHGLQRDPGLIGGPGLRPRILVVDVDPHIRDVICFALERAGMVTDHAADGAAMRRAWLSHDRCRALWQIGHRADMGAAGHPDCEIIGKRDTVWIGLQDDWRRREEPLPLVAFDPALRLSKGRDIRSRHLRDRVETYLCESQPCRAMGGSRCGTRRYTSHDRGDAAASSRSKAKELGIA